MSVMALIPYADGVVVDPSLDKSNGAEELPPQWHNVDDDEILPTSSPATPGKKRKRVGTDGASTNVINSSHIRSSSVEVEAPSSTSKATEKPATCYTIWVRSKFAINYLQGLEVPDLLALALEVLQIMARSTQEITMKKGRIHPNGQVGNFGFHFVYFLRSFEALASPKEDC